MPRSAIATGLVDFVLPPAEMLAQLIAYVAHAFGRTPRPVSAPAPKAADALKKIFVLLRAQTGHDFSQYKENTVTFTEITEMKAAQAALRETGTPQECELRMLRADAAPFWARLESTVASDGESGDSVCRVVVSDTRHAP